MYDTWGTNGTTVQYSYWRATAFVSQWFGVTLQRFVITSRLLLHVRWLLGHGRRDVPCFFCLQMLWSCCWFYSFSLCIVLFSFGVGCNMQALGWSADAKVWLGCSSCQEHEGVFDANAGCPASSPCQCCTCCSPSLAEQLGLEEKNLETFCQFLLSLDLLTAWTEEFLHAPNVFSHCCQVYFILWPTHVIIFLLISSFLFNFFPLVGFFWHFPRLKLTFVLQMIPMLNLGLHCVSFSLHSKVLLSFYSFNLTGEDSSNSRLFLCCSFSF